MVNIVCCSLYHVSIVLTARQCAAKQWKRESIDQIFINLLKRDMNWDSAIRYMFICMYVIIIEFIVPHCVHPQSIDLLVYSGLRCSVPAG